MLSPSREKSVSVEDLMISVSWKCGESCSFPMSLMEGISMSHSAVIWSWSAFFWKDISQLSSRCIA